MTLIEEVNDAIGQLEGQIKQMESLGYEVEAQGFVLEVLRKCRDRLSFVPVSEPPKKDGPYFTHDEIGQISIQHYTKALGWEDDDEYHFHTRGWMELPDVPQQESE